MHNISLSFAQVRALRECLEQAHWYKAKPTDAIVAYHIIENILSGFTKPEEDEGDTSFHIELTEKQRDACKNCLRYFRDQGVLNINKATMPLLIHFGLDEE